MREANVNPPNSIRFGREVCGDLVQAERREWWLANGLGAYAAGTVAGTLTRRYHGLLIAPVNPPLGRHLVFAKADATLIAGDRETPLYSNRWAAARSTRPDTFISSLSSFRAGCRSGDMPSAAGRWKRASGWSPASTRPILPIACRAAVQGRRRRSCACGYW